MNKMMKTPSLYHAIRARHDIRADTHVPSACTNRGKHRSRELLIVMILSERKYFAFSASIAISIQSFVSLHYFASATGFPQCFVG